MKNPIVKNPFQDPEIPKRTSWSYSSLKLFRKCKRKFYWKHVFRLRPRREPSALVISSAVHEALAKWYSLKRASMHKIVSNIINTVQRRAEQAANFYDQEEYDDLLITLNTLQGILTAYAEVYSQDSKLWQATKKDVEVWFTINLGPFDFKGRIDLLPTCKGKLFIVDHKVVSRIGESFVEKLPMDGQLRGYILGVSQGLKLKPVKVVYNLIRKCKLRQKSQESLEEFTERIKEDYLSRPDFYFQRETLLFSKNDVEAFEHDLRKTHSEYAWLVDNSSDPLDPREWPCNDDMCNEYFRTCEYFPLCTQCLDAGTSKLYTQYNKKGDYYEDL